MNRVNVMLHIIPSGVKLEDLENYDIPKHGRVLSNSNEIKVNKVTDGYSIVYASDTFKRIDVCRLSRNIKQLFRTNLPGAIIDIGIYYHYELDNDDEVVFDEDVANWIFTLEHCIVNDLVDRTFVYHRTESLSETQDYYDEMNDPDDEFESMFGLNDFDVDDDDDEDSDDPFAFMKRSSDRKKSKSKSYGRSRVLKNAKNPKRAYRRHGVLIARDKDDLRRDEKIIKAFLKEFIPGNSGWKKDLRSDILDRWIRMYALSKKNINKLEKEYRRSVNVEKNKANADMALDFTRKLFNVPIDRWNDPSK